MANFSFDQAKGAVVKVGDGRGFVVEAGENRYIITAGHCLPQFPPCFPYSDVRERTYALILGPIGEEPAVSAECVFVDPIGDIAILAEPDDQVFFDESDAYLELVADVVPFCIADSPPRGSAWLLSLDGRWTECVVIHQPDGPLWISGAENIAGGMSGSPVLTGNGSAIGVVCTGDSDGDDNEVSTEGGPNASLVSNLPGWILRKLGIV